jgi:hypothetical protein
MSVKGSEPIFSNNFYNPVFLQKDSTRQALKKVSMVAGAVLLASALAPCVLASVPLLAKITIMKSAGALGWFILAKLMPRGRDHLSREAIISQWFQSQPENAKAEAQQLLDLLKTVDFSVPFDLKFTRRTEITSLPNVLQNCRSLTCFGCTNLQTLPDLPICDMLDCRGCTNLQDIPDRKDSPQLVLIYLEGCTRLSDYEQRLGNTRLSNSWGYEIHEISRSLGT